MEMMSIQGTRFFSLCLFMRNFKPSCLKWSCQSRALVLSLWRLLMHTCASTSSSSSWAAVSSFQHVPVLIWSRIMWVTQKFFSKSFPSELKNSSTPSEEVGGVSTVGRIYYVCHHRRKLQLLRCSSVYVRFSTWHGIKVLKDGCEEFKNSTKFVSYSDLSAYVHQSQTI